jgi:alpha-ketoglutarate-dependent taurine dioxygenase
MELKMIWETPYDPANPAKAFSELVAAWRDQDKRVFVLRASDEVPNVREFFEERFSMLGAPVALAEDVNVGDRGNQRTGEIWMEVRYDPRHPDAYRHSANAQPLHTDGSYIPDFPNATLMACVANAGEGGETTFVSSEALVSCLELENPDLLKNLVAMDITHSRSGDARTERVIDRSSFPTRVNWNYYCLSNELEADERAVAESFFQYLQSSPMIRKNTLAVKLGPGDAVTWKDRELLHGRNGFQATHESERFIWKCAIDIGRIN